MDDAEFERVIAGFGWKRRDKWHIDTGDGTLVRPGAVSRNLSQQLAFLLRRRAAIQAVRDEANAERTVCRKAIRTTERRRSR